MKEQNEKIPAKEKPADGTRSELDELEAEARAEEAAKKEGFDFVSSGPEKTAPSIVLEPRYYASMWKGLFAVIARRSGEHWNLTDAEALNLGEVSGPVVDKYLPTVLNKYGAEVALGAAVFFVCMPRMGKGLDEKESGSVGHSRSKGSGKVYSATGAFKEKTI